MGGRCWWDSACVARTFLSSKYVHQREATARTKATASGQECPLYTITIRFLVQLKSFQMLLTNRLMNRFALLLLLSGLAFAQAGQAPPPRAPLTGQPAAPLN